MKKKNVEIEDLTDPTILIKIINTIMDPKNPDSNKIKNEIVKNVASIIKKDDAFLTTIKGMVISRAEEITQKLVQSTMDECREQLTDALTVTINAHCEEFFTEKRSIIEKILKQKLEKCVQEIIESTKKLIDISNKKLDTVKTENVSISVPLQHKEKIEEYIEFLTRKN